MVLYLLHLDYNTEFRQVKTQVHRFFCRFCKSSMFIDVFGRKKQNFLFGNRTRQNITPRPNAYEKFAFLWKILVTPKENRTQCRKISRQSFVPIFGAKAHTNRRLNRQYATHFRQNPQNSGNTKIKRNNSLDKLFALCNNMFTALLYGIFL